jgi:hypothetical protein
MEFTSEDCGPRVSVRVLAGEENAEFSKCCGLGRNLPEQHDGDCSRLDDRLALKASVESLELSVFLGSHKQLAALAVQGAPNNAGRRFRRPRWANW